MKKVDLSRLRVRRATTTTTVTGSSGDQTTFEFNRALTYPEEQEGWHQVSYEHHTVYSEQTTYPDGTVDDYGWDETDNDAGGIDPDDLIHPPLASGIAPPPLPADALAAANAANPPSGDLLLLDSGTLASGKTWELWGDDVNWYYYEYNTEGDLVEERSGTHSPSTYLLLGTAQNLVAEKEPPVEPPPPPATYEGPSLWERMQAATEFLGAFVGGLLSVINEAAESAEEEPVEEEPPEDPHRHEKIARLHWLQGRLKQIDETLEGDTGAIKRVLRQDRGYVLEDIHALEADLGVGGLSERIRREGSAAQTAREAFEANDQVMVLETSLDIGTAALPGVSDARDIMETYSGEDAITERKLSTTERIFTGASILLPFVGGPALRKLLGKADDVADAANDTIAAVNSASGVRRTIPNRIVQDEVDDFIIRNGRAFADANGKVKVVDKLGPIIPGKGRKLASFNSVEKQITIYQGAEAQDIVEELVHFKQSIRDGVWGKMIPTDMARIWEDQVDNVFKNLGMVP